MLRAFSSPGGDGMLMNPHDLRDIIRQVLDEEHERAAKTADDLVLKTVSTILSSFGIEEDDRKELRADFRHLRKWRKSVEQVEMIGWKTAITVVVTGVLGAIWIGFKTLLGK